MRSLLIFASTMLVAVFGWLLTAVTPVAAAPATDATWSGTSIVYNNETFSAAGQAGPTDPSKLPQGSWTYVYQDTSGKTTEDDVIYFNPSADPTTAKTAHYAIYDVSGNSLSNPHSKADITIDPSGATLPSVNSCNVGGNLGWIICPISDFLATGMDKIFDVISSFIVVQPAAVGDTSSPLYIAWNLIRTIANVAFILVFLILIYSQLTGGGFSNYTIKKLMPRLVVAAVLVNLSYYIGALAIDVSNILGYSIHDLFNNLRTSLFDNNNQIAANTGAGDLSATNWQNVTTAILGGSTVAVGGMIGISAATAGDLGAGIYVLLPALIGLILALVLVMIILAARQALITILLIVSPLAFVANLLPNTEKLFKQWGKLFMTMLVFFPAFSFVFAGAQLASSVIIQNANSILVVLLGLIVQVAPLAIAPLLIKLSGDTLGKVAGVLNNQRKNLVGQAREWAKPRAEMRRQMAISRPTGFMNIAQAMAKRSDIDDQNIKDRTALYGARNDNTYHRTRQYQRLHRLTHAAELDKDTIENNLNAHTQAEAGRVGSAMNLKQIQMEASKAKLAEETQRTTAMVEEFKSGSAPVSGELGRLQTQLRDSTVNTAVEAQRAQSAQYMQQRNLSTILKSGTMAGNNLLHIAAGVDPNGEIRARANAIAALAKLDSEALDNSIKLLTSDAQTNGMSLKDYAVQVVIPDANAGGGAFQPQLIEAALEAAAQDGQTPILRKARMSRNVDQDMLDRVIARNVGTMKEKGGFDLQANPKLRYATEEEMDVSRAGMLGGVSAQGFAALKGAEITESGTNIGRILTATKATGKPEDLNNLYDTYVNITEALNNPEVVKDLDADHRKAMVEIHRTLHAEFLNPGRDIDYVTKGLI